VIQREKGSTAWKVHPPLEGSPAYGGAFGDQRLPAEEGRWIPKSVAVIYFAYAE